MGLIPKKLKNLFSGKARKAEAAAPEAQPAAAPAAAPAVSDRKARRAAKKAEKAAKKAARKAAKLEAKKAKAAPASAPAREPANENEIPLPTRLDRLAPVRAAEGYYLLNLTVTQTPFRGGPAGRQMLMLQAPEADFMATVVGPSPLAGAKTVATAVEDHLQRAFGLDIGEVYFKAKGQEFYFRGYDETIGLPPGDVFQVVAIPEGCAWRPNPYATAPMYSPLPGTGTILQPPHTLLPWYQQPVPWQVMYVNGMNMSEFEHPRPPGGPAPEIVELDALPGRAAEQVAAEAARQAVTAEPGTPQPSPAEAKPQPAAAAAPPPPPKPPRL